MGVNESCSCFEAFFDHGMNFGVPFRRRKAIGWLGESGFRAYLGAVVCWQGRRLVDVVAIRDGETTNSRGFSAEVSDIVSSLQFGVE